jgi:hypothetical protein
MKFDAHARSHVSLMFLSVANLHAFLWLRLRPSAGHKVREGAAIWFRGAVLVRLAAYVAPDLAKKSSRASRRSSNLVNGSARRWVSQLSHKALNVLYPVGIVCDQS